LHLATKTILKLRGASRDVTRPRFVCSRLFLFDVISYHTTRNRSVRGTAELSHRALSAAHTPKRPRYYRKILHRPFSRISICKNFLGVGDGMGHCMGMARRGGSGSAFAPSGARTRRNDRMSMNSFHIDLRVKEPCAWPLCILSFHVHARRRAKRAVAMASAPATLV
jgi:hypothetical protein